MTEPTVLSARAFTDKRGALSIWDQLPFPVVRMFAIADVPPNEKRGDHAHRTCQQVIMCTSGSFYLTAAARVERKWYMRPGRAVYIPAKHWISLGHFSADGAALVLASEPYTEPVSKWIEFQHLVNGDKDDSVC